MNTFMIFSQQHETTIDIISLLYIELVIFYSLYESENVEYTVMSVDTQNKQAKEIEVFLMQTDSLACYLILVFASIPILVTKDSKLGITLYLKYILTPKQESVWQPTMLSICHKVN